MRHRGKYYEWVLVMLDYPADSRRWLIGCLGRKLDAVNALIYTHKDEKDVLNPIALALHFSSLVPGQVRGCGDGESIEWLDSELVPLDLGEYGHATVENVSDSPVWSSVIGCNLVDLYFLESAVSSCIVGWQFVFDSGAAISIVNWGDELFVFDTIPNEILKEVNPELVRVFPN